MFGFVYEDGTSNFLQIVGNEFAYRSVISASGKNVVRVMCTYSYYGMNYIRNMFIAEYTGDNSYTPYVKHSLPIPEAVRSKPWYGLGISKDVCNAIRYNADGGRSGDVKCAEADLGTLAFERFLDGGEGVFRVDVSDRAKTKNLIYVM